MCAEVERRQEEGGGAFSERRSPAFGGTPNSFRKMGGNQWDALRASHLLALKKPLSSVLESLLYQARTYFQNK